MGLGVLEIIFLIALVGGAMLIAGRRKRIVESSHELQLVRDPSNPYEPSNITTHVVHSRTASGLAGIAILLLAGLMIAAVLAFALLRASVVVPAPVILPSTAVPPPPPPPSVQI